MTGGTQVIGPALFGFNSASTGGGSGGLPSGLESAAVSPMAGLAAPAYSPDNPLFWFAVLLVGGAALALFSGHVKPHAGAKAGAAVDATV